MIYGKNQEQLLQTLLVIRTYMENVFKTRMPKKKKTKTHGCLYPTQKFLSVGLEWIRAYLCLAP